MSLLIFLTVLSVLVVVHEWGHFITAKSLGVRVEKFSLGFGPKLLSRVHDGTEFMLCAIPLGGYVKMAGDERTNCKGEKDEYYAQPPGHRALIVVMGPVVNYILAYLCFCVVFIFGYPTLASKVGEVVSGYPAQISDLKKGDTIIRIDSVNIQSWEDIQKYIVTSRNEQLNFTILRDGQKISKVITPRHEVITNIFGQKENIRMVGIKPEDEIVVLKFGFVESIVKAFTNLVEITTTTYKALYRMATGAMSPKDTMTGPLGIYDIIKKAAAMGFFYLLYVVGIISASLAIFNLLPFPVLDGGHIFFLTIEKIRGKNFSPQTDEVVSKIGFSLIICLALFVFYADFERFGWIDKIKMLWNHFGF